MSSSGPRVLRWYAALAVLSVTPVVAAAQDGAADAAQQGDAAPGAKPVTAEEALDTARDAYAPPAEQTVTACPEDSVEADEKSGGGDVIVVCRQVNSGEQYRIEHVPSPRLDRTADGVPRAPDVTTIPSCTPGGQTVCVKFGHVPPPVLMVDVTKFPEPLAPEVAAKVSRAPDDATLEPPPVTGERVPIPTD